MTKKFNLSRTLTGPRSQGDILLAMHLMKSIREAGKSESSVQTAIPVMAGETLIK